MSSSDPDEIRRRMAQLRAELQYNVSQLRSQAQSLTDWRYYVRRYPWVILTATAVVGFLLVPRGIGLATGVGRAVGWGRAWGIRRGLNGKAAADVTAPAVGAAAVGGGVVALLAGLLRQAVVRAAMAYGRRKLGDALRQSAQAPMGEPTEQPMEFDSRRRPK